LRGVESEYAPFAGGVGNIKASSGKFDERKVNPCPVPDSGDESLVLRPLGDRDRDHVVVNGNGVLVRL
jgi:hypothetical protein